MGVVYKPPNTDVDSFNVHITNILTKLKGEIKIVYLLGDFNIDLLFLPLINKPTRVTKCSATLIDNIFCNNVFHTDIFQGICCTDVSDHFPIFSIDYSCYTFSKKEYVFCRQYTQSNIGKFSEMVKQVN